MDTDEVEVDREAEEGVELKGGGARVTGRRRRRREGGERVVNTVCPYACGDIGMKITARP
jgi:hypothetical protein